MAVNASPETERAPRRRFLPLRWTGGLSTRLLLLTAAFAIVVDLLILAPAAASFHERWLTDRVRAAEVASLSVEAASYATVDDTLADRLLVGVGAEIALLLLFVYTPVGNAFLGTAPLEAPPWLLIVVLAVTFGLLEELRKLFVRRRVRLRPNASAAV